MSGGMNGNRDEKIATYYVTLSNKEWQKLADGEELREKLMFVPGWKTAHDFVEVVIQRAGTA